MWIPPCGPIVSHFDVKQVELIQKVLFILLYALPEEVIRFHNAIETYRLSAEETYQEGQEELVVGQSLSAGQTVSRLDHPSKSMRRISLLSFVLRAPNAIQCLAEKIKLPLKDFAKTWNN